MLAGQARLQLVQSRRDGRFALGDAGDLLGQLLMVIQQQQVAHGAGVFTDAQEHVIGQQDLRVTVLDDAARILVQCEQTGNGQDCNAGQQRQHKAEAQRKTCTQFDVCKHEDSPRCKNAGGRGCGAVRQSIRYG